jgi:hypothetical protein
MQSPLRNLETLKPDFLKPVVSSQMTVLSKESCCECHLQPTLGILPDGEGERARIGLPATYLPKFSQFLLTLGKLIRRGNLREYRGDGGRAERFFRGFAPGVWHPAVDGLHSIDFPADKTLPFLLTLEIEGVKTNSFFDSF